jgi:AAA ATPase domain
VAHLDGGSADRSSESASHGSPSAQVGIFARSGVYWTISYGGTTFSLKDIKGLSYIQRLLRHPGEEFHALDLLNEPGAGPGFETTSRDKALSQGGSVAGLGDAGEMLDARAKQDYKRRLRELTGELEDLRERDNQERAEKVESEIEFLTREIARAVGLGGRDRRAGSVAERARLSATRTIKAALQKVAEHHPSLGEMLGRSVRTGSFCCYFANPRVPITWQFSLEGAKPSVETEATACFLLRGETRLLWALTGRTTFVGREVERTTLRRYLERARHGEGSVVMIGGAPGVGKTRIAGEVGAEASLRGCLVLVGSCYDREDSVPFIPFIEILEAELALAPSPQPSARRWAATPVRSPGFSHSYGGCSLTFPRRYMFHPSSRAGSFSTRFWNLSPA